MPKVGSKHFAYTKKGVKAAKNYARKLKTERMTRKKARKR